MPLTYTGPARGVSILAHMLRDEGVEPQYQAPMERKDMASIAENVIVPIVTVGPQAVIAAVVARFMKEHPGTRIDGLPVEQRTVADRLKELTQLRNDGTITPEEHDEQRRRILGEL